MSDPISPLSPTTDFYPPIEVFVPRAPRQRYWVHLALLLATILTTLVVGARMEFNFLHHLPVFYTGEDSLAIFPVIWAFQGHLALGVPFSFTLMLILLAHEMGHYVYCRRYRVWATLPFFIPFPTLIGTLGAFIRIRSPIRSRGALFDIGIAGPIAGFVVALVILFLSLGLSQPMMPGLAAAGDIQLGFPLIFYGMHSLLVGMGLAHGAAALPLTHAYLHPVAVAAWVGMFATALNLLPGGQLDGGHIVFALAPRAHRWVSRVTILALIPMAVYLWSGWALWAVLLGLSGMRHPQVPGWPGVDGQRRWLAVVGLLMLILTLAPAPFANSSLLAVIRQLRAGQ
jgi:membrane-associated protease RseP (regulator of RpoE activity)